MPKSANLPDRFSSWTRFARYLKIEGFSKDIISLAKKLHDKIVKEIPLHNDLINYTVHNDISFKRPSPVNGEKNVFAYIQIKPKKISLYLSHGGEIPEGENVRINPNNQGECIITMQPDYRFTPTDIDPIRFSYNRIIAGQR
jgi:hypothetical protein